MAHPPVPPLLRRGSSLSPSSSSLSSSSSLKSLFFLVGERVVREKFLLCFFLVFFSRDLVSEHSGEMHN